MFLNTVLMGLKQNSYIIISQLLSVDYTSIQGQHWSRSLCHGLRLQTWRFGSVPHFNGGHSSDIDTLPAYVDQLFGENEKFKKFRKISRFCRDCRAMLRIGTGETKKMVQGYEDIGEFIHMCYAAGFLLHILCVYKYKY